MHSTAFKNCQDFYSSYYSDSADIQSLKVVEIGSQNVNGSLKSIFPSNVQYWGLDFQVADGVDIVMTDPYSIPFANESIDLVLSSSCFEHSEMFWLIFLEILRVLKPNGLFYLNAPSAGSYHRFPVDCWRFYPDSGIALVKWAKRNNIDAALMESFIQKGGDWQDFVGVFIKNKAYSHEYTNRITYGRTDFENSHLYGSDFINKHNSVSQNETKIQLISQIANGTLEVVASEKPKQPGIQSR